jgi:hypothetical protein
LRAEDVNYFTLREKVTIDQLQVLQREISLQFTKSHFWIAPRLWFAAAAESARWD